MEVNLRGIKKIVAIGSGKGGVGKSTVTINLACAMARAGHKVGILDADIYGPSLPIMFDIHDKPGFEEGQMIPHEKQNIKLMSIGFMMGGETPLIWRGPMIQKALQQLLFNTNWGELDYLFIDMPPGTGDIQLTLAQKVPLSGAIIVSTPQDIALIDAKKAVHMFNKVNVPILGLIENMSYFNCPHCHENTYIFDHENVKKYAQDNSIKFLGEIPLKISIRENMDQGTPGKIEDVVQKIFDDMVINI